MYIYVHVPLMGTVDVWDYFVLWMKEKVLGGMQVLQEHPCTCTYMHMAEDFTMINSQGSHLWKSVPNISADYLVSCMT